MPLQRAIPLERVFCSTRAQLWMSVIAAACHPAARAPCQRKSVVVPLLFWASTQDDESVAQMVDLGSGTGTISRQRAGWFRRATQQMARWAGVAESDR
jgi:hypothetical protein